MIKLVEKVEKWSKEKGLDQADSNKQFLKVTEEVGEVAAALARNDENALREEIGDVAVTLIILAQQKDMDLYECLNQAYTKISNRQGKMIDGVFVKEADLAKEQLDYIKIGGKELRVFQVCESDAVAAETSEGALEWYKNLTGLDDDELYALDDIEVVDPEKIVQANEDTEETITVREIVEQQWNGKPFIAITSVY